MEATWIATGKQMKADLHTKEADYYAFLMTGEKMKDTLWPEFAEFEQFLTSKDVNLCDAARYRGARKAITELGIEQVRLLGVDAAMSAVSVSSKPERTAVVQELKLRTEGRAVPLSKREADRVRDVMVPPPPRPGRKTLAETKRLEDERQRREETKQQKHALKKAQERILDLEREVDGLRAKLSLKPKYGKKAA